MYLIFTLVGVVIKTKIVFGVENTKIDHGETSRLRVDIQAPRLALANHVKLLYCTSPSRSSHYSLASYAKSCVTNAQHVQIPKNVPLLSRTTPIAQSLP
jgi:hypothetical protein